MSLVMLSFYRDLSLVSGILIRVLNMDDQLITIFTPNNQAEFLIIKSMLEDQGIRTWSKNEHVQNLFGMGQLGTGYNFVTGPIRIQVLATDLARARETIENYFENDQNLEKADFYIKNNLNSVSDSESLSDEMALKKFLIRSFLYSFFWIFGLGSILGIYYAEQARRLVKRSCDRLRGKGFILFCYLYGIIGIFIAVIYFRGFLI
jgi:hypothetical protein